MGKIGKSSAVRYVTIDSQRHRVRVPQAISDVVPWLRGKASLQCLGFPGPHGGVHVAPVGGRAAAIHDRVVASLERDPPTVDDVAAPLVELATFFAGAFPIDFRFERSSNRFSIVLTTSARKSGLLPSEGIITLVAVNEVLQLWPRDEWVRYQSTVNRNLERIGDRLDNGGDESGASETGPAVVKQQEPEGD